MVRRKHGHEEEHESGGGGHGGASGRWLVSYADFITLMFVVFTVLFSMARVDSAKYGALASSLKSALGPAGAATGPGGPDLGPIASRGLTGTPIPVIQPDHPGNLPDIPDWPAHLIGPPPEEPRRIEPPPDEPPPPVAQPSENPQDPKTIEPPGPVQAPPDEYAELEKALKTLPGFRSGLLAVSLEQSGLTLSIAGKVLFEPGQTELRPAAREILGEVIPKLQGVELPVWVYGTADEQPVQGSLAPAYLAAMRGAAVVTYFQEQGLGAKEFVNISTSGGEQDHYRVTIVVQRRR